MLLFEFAIKLLWAQVSIGLIPCLDVPTCLLCSIDFELKPRSAVCWTQHQSKDSLDILARIRLRLPHACKVDICSGILHISEYISCPEPELPSYAEECGSMNLQQSTSVGICRLACFQDILFLGNTQIPSKSKWDCALWFHLLFWSSCSCGLETWCL